MKTRLLFIAGLMLMSFQLKANHANAVFKTDNGAPMVVFLDGNRINEYPSDVVRLNKIYPGKHFVRIKVMGKRFDREIKQRIFLRRDHKSKFLISSHGRRRQLSMAKVNEKPMYYRPYVRYPYSQERYPRPERYHRSGYDVLDMQRFMYSLNLRRFDNEQVHFTKRVLAKKSLYAEDLLEILNGIKFESNKVEVADFAYASVIDKKNFHIVYDAFRYQSSIRQLEKGNYGETWF